MNKARTNERIGINPMTKKEVNVANAAFRGCFSCIFCKSFFDFMEK